jgi:hypothetical protein
MQRAPRLGFVAALLVAAVSCSSHPDPRKGAGSPAPAPTALLADSLTGWFHVIWGNGPEYALVGTSGEAVRLILQPAVLDSIGDPLVLDRQRVTVLGQRVEARSPAMRVFLIRPSQPEN